MDPTAAIAVIENDLRHLVKAIMSKKHGADWLEQVLGPDDIEKLEKRRTEEARRRAPSAVPDSLIAYTHFYQLRKIIEKSWQDFAPALGDKKEFSVLANKVEDYRNAPAHSRELLPHERSLLEGIAGTVRTLVTTFLSTLSPDTKHYPVIEWIRDSFGNEPEELTPAVNALLNTGLRLRVGDEVTFNARGWDPQGRALKWLVTTFPGDALRGDEVAEGTDVTFSWTVTEASVGENQWVQIDVMSDGRFHRHQSYDHRITFRYSVDPPDVGNR